MSEECVPVDDVISGLTPEQIEVGREGGYSAWYCEQSAVCVLCPVVCCHSHGVLSGSSMLKSYSRMLTRLTRRTSSAN